ncbi:unnamed protein product [Rotaria sp. Silwood2]|nr:unnamed protein product [Rotaria sp. Silwood2]CAF2645708.1 unnamed protein product [Rotaria sp. Silwood2]CAF4333149.1 unnamed protein product [Rotaria sp. Silwood2]
MEQHQRLLYSSSHSPRYEWRQHTTYFPPSPPITNNNNNNNNNSWIRPTSSTLTKVTPNSDDNSNYYHSWLHTIPTPSSPILNSTHRQRYTPRFASIKSHSPNYYPLMQANLQKDTTFTKIFVGGLPYHTTDETLRAFFLKFGEIEEAVVINDRSTGKSRGYGFVTMVHKEDAEEAVKDPNPTIDGRRANVNLAYMGAKNRTTLPLSYGVLARMPTYQSTATAYPSNVIYYPLTQQSTIQQPIYIAPTTGATATTWPSNLFSQFNLANLATTTSNTNVSGTLNPGTSSPQTLYEVPTALFESSAIVSPTPTIGGNAQTTGQQLYWSGYS